MFSFCSCECDICAWPNINESTPRDSLLEIENTNTNQNTVTSWTSYIHSFIYCHFAERERERESDEWMPKHDMFQHLFTSQHRLNVLIFHKHFEYSMLNLLFTSWVKSYMIYFRAICLVLMIVKESHNKE